MSDMTRNEELVFTALRKSKTPQTAYILLDALRADGLRAPPQIYRALEKLIAKGMVHRIESLNAYLACNHPDCPSHALAAFTICEQCGSVGEINDPSLARKLKGVAGDDNFDLATSTVELRGICTSCR